MTDRKKRARLREILADSKGAIAPGITDPIFARLAADCGYPLSIYPAMRFTRAFAFPTGIF